MAKQKPTTDEPDDITTQSGILRLLGITRRRLVHWETTKALPRHSIKPARYSRRAVLDWLVEQASLPDAMHTVKEREAHRAKVGYIAEVAAFFGVAAVTVKSWIANGMPGEVGSAKSPGNFPLDEIAQWLRARDNERHKKQTNEQTDRVNKLKADRLSIELQKLNGELLDRKSAELWLAGYIRRVRDLLDRLPDEIGSQTPPEIRDEVRDNVRGYIGAILTEASAWKIDDEVAEQLATEV